MIQIKKGIVSSTDASKYINRIGTEDYFKQCVALQADKVTDFREVDELPKIDENLAEGQALENI